MPAVPPGELSLLSFQASVSHYLAFAPFRVIFACSLNNASATWNETVLPYDNVTVGNVAAVEEAAWGTVANSSGELLGQTVLVYDSGGTYKGKVRLRYISETSITVAANDHIEWADDDLLRVLDYFEVWSYPTNTVDTGDGLEYHKDYDIDWVDNDTAFPPKANGGVGWAGDVGTTIHFDGSDSRACASGAAISSWHWYTDGTFEEGTAATDEDIAISFDNAGFRWVILVVTDSNGKRGVHRIPIWVFGGDYQPHEGFTIKRRVMEIRDTTAEIEAWGDGIDEDTVLAGTLLIVFSKTTLNGVEVTADLGCYFEDRRPIMIIGWILKDSVIWDYEKGKVTFSVGTIGKVADEVPGFATFLSDVDAGSEEDWHTGSGLTVQNVIYFMLHWHSNIDTLAHVVIEPTELIGGRKFKQAAPLKQIENALLSPRGVFAHLGVSRYSSIHILYDPQEASDVWRAAHEKVMDLTSSDWTDEAKLERAHRPHTSDILGGGIYYDGSTATPYRGRAPGSAGLYGGSFSRADNLIIEGQDDLNTKLGRLLAAEANEWAEQPLNLAYDVFEPALQEYVTLTVAASENLRGYVFTTSDQWIVRRAQIVDKPGQVPEVRASIEKLVTGYQGVTVPIPDPDEWNWPDPPPIPPIPPVVPIDAGGTGEGWVFGTIGGGVVYTFNMVSGNPPTFWQLNGGLGDATNIRWGPVGDTSRPSTHLACIDDSAEVYVNTDWRNAANWTLALSNAAAKVLIDAAMGVTTDEIELRQVHAHCASVDETGTLVVLADVDVDGVASHRTIYFLYSKDWGTTWTAFAPPTGYSYTPVGDKHAADDRWNINYKKQTIGPDTSFGSIVFYENQGTSGAGNIVLGARCGSGGLGRSNVVYGGYSGWNNLGFGSCPPWPGLTEPCNIGGAIGTPDEWGPGAMCVVTSGDSHDDRPHFSRWKEHECTGTTAYILLGHASFATGDTMHVRTYGPSGSDLDDYYACCPDMMASAFPTNSIYYWALNIDTVTLETYVMKCTSAVTPTLQATLDEPCMGIWCYRVLVDGYCVLVAGRGYTTATKVSGPGDTDLLYLSVNNGATWIEKGSALYDDYNVVGIVGAFSDHSED